MKQYIISPQAITLEDIGDILNGEVRLSLSPESEALIIKCRNYLDHKLQNSEERMYGINTGFGALYNVAIDKDQLATLQRNLVMSHACGIGPRVPDAIVKLMLFLKVRSLSFGYSGVQLKTVQRLMDFYNEDIIPVVYEQGSLGASGDLAPLAHLSLPLLGLGEVIYRGRKISGRELHALKNWEPVVLQSKEGLALLNGTQFMCAYGLWCVNKALRLARWADVIGALSLDAYDGRIEPFTPEVHSIRPHPGQAATAKAIFDLLRGSALIKRPKEHVQDPYSFRCMPQVHGAAKDCIDYVKGVITDEMNAATDNPTIFPDLDKVVSAGNFHGEPLALAMDFLSMGVAELGSISERRINQLLLGKRGLPLFLVAHSGLNSGFMIPQYTAASIVSQNKGLCMPASVDSIDSSRGQEDHVSMGSNAALKCYRVLCNTERVLAIELFNAAQALDFRRPLRSSPVLEDLMVQFRKKVNFVAQDCVMYPAIQAAVDFIDNHTF